MCGNKTTSILPSQKHPQCIFYSFLTRFKVSQYQMIFSIGLFTTSMTTAYLITSTMHLLIAYSWILSSCSLCKLYIVEVMPTWRLESHTSSHSICKYLVTLVSKSNVDLLLCTACICFMFQQNVYWHLCKFVLFLIIDNT